MTIPATNADLRPAGEECPFCQMAKSPVFSNFDCGTPIYWNGWMDLARDQDRTRSCRQIEQFAAVVDAARWARTRGQLDHHPANHPLTELLNALNTLDTPQLV